MWTSRLTLCSVLWRSSSVSLSPLFLFWPSFSWPFYPRGVFFGINLNTQQRYDATIPWDTRAASIPSWVYFNLWTLILARLDGSPCRVCTPHTEQGVGMKTEQSCLQRKELTYVRGNTVAVSRCTVLCSRVQRNFSKAKNLGSIKNNFEFPASSERWKLFLAWNVSSLVPLVSRAVDELAEASCVCSY